MKKFAVIFLALVLTLTFVACGNTDTASSENASTVVDGEGGDAEIANEPDTTESSAVVGDNDAAMPDSWLGN